MLIELKPHVGILSLEANSEDDFSVIDHVTRGGFTHARGFSGGKQNFAIVMVEVGQALQAPHKLKNNADFAVTFVATPEPGGLLVLKPRAERDKAFATFFSMCGYTLANDGSVTLLLRKPGQATRQAV